MNKKMISFVIGKILILEAGLMLLPLIISFLYKEDILHKMSYGIVILLLLAVGFLMSIKVPADKNIQGRERKVLDI